MAKEDKGKEEQPGKIAILAVLLVFVGCGCLGVKLLSGDDGESNDEANTTVTTPGANASESYDPEWASIFDTWESENGYPAEPDIAAQFAYLADLDVINPEIVGNHSTDTMVDRGRRLCADFLRYADDHKKVVEQTNYWFTAPNYSSGFGTAIAEEIMVVVHDRLCPEYDMP